MQNEMRSLSFEFRAAEGNDGDGRTLEGYAAVFNQDTEINSWEGSFIERLAPGAFRKTLREKRNVIMQFDHGHDVRVGRTPIGVFEELSEDANGLKVRGRLFDNPVVEPVRQAIEAQAIAGMSFRFQTVRDEWRDAAGKLVKPDQLMDLLWNPGDKGPLVRTVKEVKLFEAGPVVTPAYAGTSVGVRHLADLTEDERKSLVADYIRTMDATDDEDERLAEWLDAEARYNADVESWLSAEHTEHVAEWLAAEDGYQARCTEWLAAEAAHNTPAKRAADKAPAKRTPETDAVRAGTSTRNPKETNPIRKESVVMTLDELRARADELRAGIAAASEEYRDAEMPAEAQADFDAADAELRTVEGKIAAVEARIERVRGLAAKPGNTDSGSQKAPAFHPERDIHNLDALRAESNSPEDFAERARENAHRFVDSVRAPRGVKREAAQERMADLLDNYDTEDGLLAKRMLLTGSPLYERAFGKALKAGNTYGLTNDEARAMSLGVAGEGGYAVPVQLDPTVILTSAGVVGNIRNVARVETIVGKEWQGITSAGVTVTRSAEAAESTDDSFTIAQPTVKAERVDAFVPFSIEVDSDWGGLRSEITRMLVDAKDREESSSFATGSGVSPNAEGFVTNASTLSAGAGTATASGLKGQMPAVLYALEESLDARFRANGKFVANKTVFNLIRQVDTAGGANLWERIGAGTPSQLLGYDALENSAMAAVYTTLSKVLAFGDFQQFLIVDRVGMSVELVPHLLGANRRPTGQRGIYAIWRNNSKLLVPNAIKVLTTLT